MPPVQIANGIEECASLDELSEKVGFEVRTPQALPFEPESIEYSSYWGDFAQVDYDGEGTHITYRVSAGSGDISGDYNDYADTAKLSIEDAEVTLKGSVGNWQLAIWKDGVFPSAEPFCAVIFLEHLLVIMTDKTVNNFDI